MTTTQQMSAAPIGHAARQAGTMDFTSSLQAKLRKRIVDYLEVSGASQSGFANDVGCSPSSLTTFLNGGRCMSLEEVVSSTQAIGMTLGELDGSPGSEKPIPILVYLKKLEYLYQADKEMFQYFTGLIDTWLNLSTNYEPGTPAQT